MGAISCIAFIGKSNNPLYIKNFSTAEDLRYHYIVNTSLDIIEEKVVGAIKGSEMYLGLLYTLEDLRIYGYITNTKIKIVLVVNTSEGLLKDSDLRSVFARAHDAYIRLVCNPFFDPESTAIISSKRFDQNIREIAAAK